MLVNTHNEMWWYFIIAVISATSDADKNVFYNNFFGTPVGEDEMKYYVEHNITSMCTTQVKPCDSFEGRRLDGTCNNLEHPSRGASRTPFIRLLPPNYGEGFGPRLSESGQPLPLERYLRTSILATGNLPDQTFTQLAMYFFVTMTQDLMSIEDPKNFVLERKYCCLPKGKTDPMCVCLKVPEDDPTLRYSNIRGLDLTKPISFQSTGCLRNGTLPERFVTSTPVFDLSEVYGNELEKSLKSRLYYRGLLKYDVEDGREYPPQSTTVPSFCSLNEPPRETRCHDAPDDTINVNIAHNMIITWLWRNHNRIASTLADLNPCWSDERVFQTARDINIATGVQILFYEFLPLIFGRRNLLMDSVLSPNPVFRDVYDSKILPQLSLEFPYVLRWGHLMIDSRLKMYDGDGKYLKQIPLVNLTLRTGYLAVDDNIDHLTQGSFRQAGGKIDMMVDPDMANKVSGPLKRASDMFTIDVARGRDFGFPPYVKYLQYCSGRSYKTFKDLADLIDNDKLEVLEELYNHVNDVELIAAMWVERSIKGGWAPPTVYCVAVEQLLRTIKSDRHWYERENRPNAFTLQQLLEIRKTTISGLLCDVGDKVTNIQRNGFVRSGPRNKMVSCSEIPKIDLTAWEDCTCSG